MKHNIQVPPRGFWGDAIALTILMGILYAVTEKPLTTLSLTLAVAAYTVNVYYRGLRTGGDGVWGYVKSLGEKAKNGRV